MIVAIHQPNYLPYLGFFHKMRLADVFVFYDTAQFSKNEFHNRNRIKTPRGTAWLTVPVRSGGLRPIRGVVIDSSKDWANSHWRTLQANYARAPFFESYADEFASLYRRSWSSLADVNEAFIRLIVRTLGVQTKTVRASELKVSSELSPTRRLSALVTEAGGDSYLSGPGGPSYMVPEEFSGGSLLLQDFRHPQYRQLWTGFLPNLSTVDLLFNEGDDARRHLERAGGHHPWPQT